MRPHHIPLFAICAFCRRPIDTDSNFWFELDDTRIVHPDCMAYTLERGPVPRGAVIGRTCGNFQCIKPDHLTLTTGEV